MARHLIRIFGWAAIASATTIGACGAASAPIEVWPTPPTVQSTPPSLPPEHPLAAVADALNAGRCDQVVALSEALEQRLIQEGRDAFHPEARADASGDVEPLAGTMREFIERYVYADPPVVVVAEHRLQLPAWWEAGFSYCLVEEERLSEARERYAMTLQEDGTDGDARWRLALVHYWLGEADVAVELLEAWPATLPVPDAYDAVLARMRARASVPKVFKLRRIR